MNFTNARALHWPILAFILGLLGCRHSAPQRSERVLPIGDPSTNVIIVPASAGWAARAGTNRLPPGIVSPQPFPFPAYDQSVVKSVYGRWRELLNDAPPAKGAVVAEFVLHEDGSISRLRLVSSDVSPRLDEICQQAILEMAPFPKWTPEMRAEIGADFRVIRIKFDFNA